MGDAGVGDTWVRMLGGDARVPWHPGVVLSQLLPQDGTLVLGAPGGYYFSGESFLPALPPRLVLPRCSLWVGTAGGGHPGWGTP